MPSEPAVASEDVGTIFERDRSRCGRRDPASLRWWRQHSGAVYTHDFIELFNRSGSPVFSRRLVDSVRELDRDRSVRRERDAADGASERGAPARAVLPRSGGDERSGGESAPDSGPRGRDPDLDERYRGQGCARSQRDRGLVATAAAAACNATQLGLIVDLVGYGGANFFEGSASTAAPANSTAVSPRGRGLHRRQPERQRFLGGDSDGSQYRVAARAVRRHRRRHRRGTRGRRLGQW